MIKFSIGIPAFKASYLEECIDSVLAQTYTNFELIVVNDASPENIDDIVNQYSDERISYYINDKNTGAVNVVDNWNKCLSYADGDYFVLMGDDDMMSPIYLEEFVKLIDKYPKLDVYHCRSYIIDEHSEINLLTPSWSEKESVLDNIWHRMNSLRVQFISDFIYDRKVLVERGGFYKLPLAWLSDDISSYIAMADKGVAHVNTPIFNYRKSNITISSSGNPDLKIKAILAAEKWFKSFLEARGGIDESDSILLKAINLRLPKYINKQKLNVITTSLTGKGLTFYSFWVKRHKEYNISKSLLFYSFIEYLKTKRLEKHENKK